MVVIQWLTSCTLKPIIIIAINMLWTLCIICKYKVFLNSYKYVMGTDLM